MAKFYQDTKILWSLPLLFFVYPIYIVLGFSIIQTNIFMERQSVKMKKWVK